tara:strand:- start:2118 stop:2462 length:345 start_codon:yes stop_codon:yes gene_type:complete
MNPLEEKLVELLQAHKEENGINALHYLEAFHTLSRVMTAVFEGKREDLMKVMANMKEEGRDEGELFEKFTNTLIAYQVQYKQLSQVQKDIENAVGYQRGSNWLEELLQSERESS